MKFSLFLLCCFFTFISPLSCNQYSVEWIKGAGQHRLNTKISLVTEQTLKTELAGPIKNMSFLTEFVSSEIDPFTINSFVRNSSAISIKWAEFYDLVNNLKLTLDQSGEIVRALHGLSLFQCFLLVVANDAVYMYQFVQPLMGNVPIEFDILFTLEESEFYICDFKLTNLLINNWCCVELFIHSTVTTYLAQSFIPRFKHLTQLIDTSAGSGKRLENFFSSFRWCEIRSHLPHVYLTKDSVKPGDYPLINDSTSLYFKNADIATRSDSDIKSNLFISLPIANEAEKQLFDLNRIRLLLIREVSLFLGLNHLVSVELDECKY